MDLRWTRYELPKIIWEILYLWIFLSKVVFSFCLNLKAVLNIDGVKKNCLLPLFVPPFPTHNGQSCFLHRDQDLRLSKVKWLPKVTQWVSGRPRVLADLCLVSWPLRLCSLHWEALRWGEGKGYRFYLYAFNWIRGRRRWGWVRQSPQWGPPGAASLTVFT